MSGSVRRRRSTSGPPASRRGAPSARRQLLLGTATALAVTVCSLAGQIGEARADSHSKDPGPPATGLGTRAARDWIIERFDVEVRVDRSGRIEVTETIRPRFSGSFNGIFRTIPIRYSDTGGFTYALRLAVSEVTDGSGNDLRYEESRQGGYREIRIWVPGARDATKTIRIRYTVDNGLRFPKGDEEFPTWDELYWNVTGDEWPVPIEHASAEIILPQEVTGLRARAFTGAYGSTESAARVELLDHRIRVSTTRPLGFGEGLTVAIAWDAGVVRRPGVADRIGAFLRANWPLFIPIGAFLLMFGLWRARGRDPETGTIVAQYEPPEGLTPGEVGVLVDNSPDMRDVTATLVDLAVRGFLTIEETETKKVLGLLSDTDYTLRLERPRQGGGWDELEAHETALLDALFGSGRTSVDVSELKNEFYRDLPRIREGLFRRLLRQRYYERRPDRVKAAYLAAAVVVAVLILVTGNIAAARLGEPATAVFAAAILTGAIVAGFGLVMPARTVRGAREYAKVLGFEEFLERVESDRFKRMITGPEMFERYLPFAMALGVETQWAAAFEDIYREPPRWYRGTDLHAFRTGAFVNDLSRMASMTSQTMASRPRSSGGSGFGGGGGFSGGGFGGGGGGAF